ncbi:MAG: phage tail tape measure protein, partial [Waterburya sp.]
MSDYVTRFGIEFDVSNFQNGYKKAVELSGYLKSKLNDVGQTAKLSGQVLSDVFNIKSDSQIKAEIKALQSAYDALKNSGNASISELARAKINLKTQTSKLNDELSLSNQILNNSFNAKSDSQIKAEIKALQSAYDALKNSGNASVGELARAKINLKTQVEKLNNELKLSNQILNNSFNIKSDNQIKSEIKALQLAYDALKNSGNASVGELARAKTALTQKTRELNNELSNTNEALQGLQAGIGLATTAAIASSFKKAAAEAINFDDALISIKQVGDFTPKGLQSLGIELKDLGREIPLTAEALADIAKAGVQANIPTGDLKDYVRTIAQVSAAFEILPEAAGESFGKIGNVYKLAVEDISLVADAINKIADTTASVKEVDLVNVTQRSAGAGQAFGITAQQVAALGGTLLSFGSAPEVAGSSINSLLNTLASANVGTKDFKSTMEKLGLPVKEFSKTIAKDGQQALNILLTELSRLDKTTQNNAISNLFGKGEDAQAILKLVSNLELYKQQQEKVANSTSYLGSVQSSFNTS